MSHSSKLINALQTVDELGLHPSARLKKAVADDLMANERHEHERDHKHTEGDMRNQLSNVLFRTGEHTAQEAKEEAAKRTTELLTADMKQSILCYAAVFMKAVSESDSSYEIKIQHFAALLESARSVSEMEQQLMNECAS